MIHETNLKHFYSSLPDQKMKHKLVQCKPRLKIIQCFLANLRVFFVQCTKVFLPPGDPDKWGIGPYLKVFEAVVGVDLVLGHCPPSCC